MVKRQLKPQNDTLFTFSNDAQAQMSLSMDGFRVRVTVLDTNQIIDFQSKGVCLALRIYSNYVAICLESGNIIIFDYTANQSFNLDIQAPCVDFVFYHVSTLLGIALGQDGSVTEFNLESRKKLRKISSKLAISDEILAVGGNQIDLIELENFKVFKTLTGHAQKITCLEFHGKDLLSCALQDRFISVWQENVKSCVVQASPVALTCGKKIFAALLENGQIALWKFKNLSKKNDPACLIQIKDDTFLSCALINDKLLVSYGNEFSPVFEYLNVKDLKNQVIERKIETPAIKAKKTPKKVQVIDANEIIQIEPSIQEKVNALEEPTKKKTKDTEMSLSQLISQAIHSSDIELFEKALLVSDKKTIHATVKRLAPSQIIALLDELTTRLQRKPSRGYQLIEWIRACLLHHSSYLQTVPNVTLRLGNLYRILDSRKDTLQKLDKIAGKLDMISFQTVEQQEEDPDLVVYDDDEMEVDSDSEIEIAE